MGICVAILYCSRMSSDVGTMVNGVGALVVGAMVVGDIVIGASVEGACIVGAPVIGAKVVGDNVVGVVIGEMVVRFTAVVGEAMAVVGAAVVAEAVSIGTVGGVVFVVVGVGVVGNLIAVFSAALLVMPWVLEPLVLQLGEEPSWWVMPCSFAVPLAMGAVVGWRVRAIISVGVMGSGVPMSSIWFDLVTVGRPLFAFIHVIWVRWELGVIIKGGSIQYGGVGWCCCGWLCRWFAIVVVAVVMVGLLGRVVWVVGVGDCKRSKWKGERKWNI